MKEIRKKTTEISGRNVDVYEKNIGGERGVTVEAGTTGNLGGHTRAYFAIDRNDRHFGMQTVDFEDGFGGGAMYFYGEAELECAVEALEFVIGVLKGEMEEKEKEENP